MSDDGATGDEASIPNVPNKKSATLKSGSRAAYGHKNTLKNLLRRYTAAHPDCRAQLCVQSANAKEIAVLLTHGGCSSSEAGAE